MRVPERQHQHPEEHSACLSAMEWLWAESDPTHDSPIPEHRQLEELEQNCRTTGACHLGKEHQDR